VAALNGLKRDVAAAAVYAVLVGLRYYEELLQRMPRAEATLLVSTVQAAVEKLAPGESASQLQYTV
jgi:hypothetical protein